MGTLRLILAVLVAVGHMQIAGGLFGVGHVIAVKAFYIISGFYMSLILNEKYLGRPISSFYTSRALRLFPLYWLVLILSVLVAIFLSPSRGHLSNFIDLTLWGDLLRHPLVNSFVLLWLAFTNFLMIGLHWAQSFCVNVSTGSIARTGIDVSSPSGYVSLISFSPIQPAWTLSIELIFYAFAPFIVRRSTRTVVVLLIAAVLLRYLMGAVGLDHNPWNRTLVAFEFVYFVMGMVAYRIYRVLLPIRHYVVKFGPGAWIGLIVLTCSWKDMLPTSFDIHQPGFYGVVYYALLMTLTPVIFLWSKDKVFDNWFGELSYPAYIAHILVLCTIDEFGGRHLFAALGSNALLWDSLHVAAIILFAWLLARTVVEPVDRLRSALFYRAARSPNKPGEPGERKD